MGTFLRRLSYLLRRSRRDAELREEIEAHRALRQEAFESDGLAPDDAADASRRALGNVTLAVEDAGDVWRPRWLHGLGLDLRLAVRALSSAPVISSVAILSIGLGIGATTAIFLVINSVYLRPLPVVHPEALVYITGSTRTGRTGAAVWRELHARQEMFAGLAAYAGAQFNISPTTEARWVDGFWVNGSFFDTLGVRPFAGRLLSAEDDRPGAAEAAVVSHALWTRRFAGTLDAIGRPLSINGVPFTIVGVTPPEFFGPTVGRSFDVIVPFAASARIASPERDISPDVMARLLPGQTVAQANAALATLPRGMDVEPPRALPATTGQPPIGFRHQYRTPLLTLMVVATLVLVIACVNIANLLLARATNRRIELSVRRALGAGRWRLVRQCLAESGVLAAAGAVSGVVIAFWASRLLVQQLARESALTVGLTMYGSSRLSLDLSFDWRVLALTMIATVATGLLFGIAPALRASAADPIDAIKAGAATSTRAASAALARPGGLRLSAMQGLIVTQVALSLALLVTAGLFLRTIASLANIPAGFDVDRVLVADVDTTRTNGDATQRMSIPERAAAVVRTLPGVASVSLSVGAPPISWGVRDSIAIADVAPAADPSAAVVLVSPEWFRVFGLPVLAGREFTERDRRGSPRVAMVNTAFVQRLLGGAAPLGRTIVSFEAPIEIVGVVGNIVSDPRGEAQPVMFIPLAQADGRLADVLDFTLASYGLTMAVRAEDRPDALIPHVAARVGQSEPRASVTFRSPRDQIAAMMVRERVLAVLSGFFGVLALLLSALGLYGVAAYAVARQRKEMAVRLALGAGARRIIGLVLGRVLLPVAVGVSLGVALTLWAGRFIAALLFGVEAHDLTTLGEAALVLLAVAAFAAWLPMVHAARIDPAVVLRYE